MFSVEKVAYGGWPNCYRVTNGDVDLVITTDVGPRVIRFGYVGGANEFWEDPAARGVTGGEAWQLFGGHRLWHAPEVSGRTTMPDNGPLTFQQGEGFVRTIQPVEPVSNIQKEMDITPAPSGAHVRIVHRLRNCGLWAVEFAPWALSVMAPGGRAIIPLPPRGVHPRDLLPNHAVVLWPYVDMSDPRWAWGRRYILLRQDAAGSPQKIGVHTHEGWMAYANGGRLFVKTFTSDSAAAYPDYGSVVETFTNGDMLEMETLGPLAKLEPGEVVEHVENWYLFQGVSDPASDADVERFLMPKIAQVKVG